MNLRTLGTLRLRSPKSRVTPGLAARARVPRREEIPLKREAPARELRHVRLVVATAVAALAAMVATSAAGPENDYGRFDLGGSQGSIEWESLLSEGLDGWEVNGQPWSSDAWRREGDTITAELANSPRARIVAGDETWRSYELKVQMTMVKGGSAQLWFNIHDNQDHHFAPLLGWQTAAIMAPDHTKLDVVNHAFERDREYDVVLAVRGRSVTTYIDGVLVNRLTLDADPKGGIGLAIWGRHTEARFRDPKVRHYYRAQHSH